MAATKKVAKAKIEVEEEVEAAVSKMGFIKRDEFDALAKQVAAMKKTPAKKAAKKAPAKKIAKKAPTKKAGKR